MWSDTTRTRRVSSRRSDCEYVCTVGGNWHIDQKTSRPISLLVPCRDKARGPENAIKALKSHVPYLTILRRAFFQFVSDLLNFYSKISYFWKVAIYGTRDLRAFIAFSRSPSLVPTWYKQQNWPPGFLVNISIYSHSAYMPPWLMKLVLLINFKPDIHSNSPHGMRQSMQVGDWVCRGLVAPTTFFSWPFES